MGVDISAVARVLGITTEFKDLRGGNVRFLPQRIALFAQGASASSFSTEKWEATSAGAGGARYGHGCPIHLALRELLPASGDGVGPITVTVYPMEDEASATPSAGDVTPSGTASATASYKLRIGGVLSKPFAIPAGAIDVTGVCRDMGQAVAAVAHMPVTVAWTYGTLVAGTCQQGTGGTTGDGTVTGLAVASGGTPVPGVWTLTCIAAATDGGTFRLTDPNGTIVKSTIDVGTAETDVGGLAFTVTDGATDYAVGNYFLLTVPATKTDFESKWAGDSANAIGIEVIDALGDLTFAITQPAGGASNPSVEPGLTQVGNVWETMVLNCLDVDDTTALDAYQAWGEGRWGPLAHKPAVVFTGVTDATVAEATVVSSARGLDRVNAQLVAPGSPNLPFVVAARQLARIARIANTNPAKGYGAQRANGLTPGLDSEQWDDAARNSAMGKGSSTIEVVDGVITIGNAVTFYHPEGEEPPAYRHVRNIVKLQNSIYNLALRFATEAWASAPLIPDDEVTVNPDARRPKDAKAEVFSVIDALTDQAILANRKKAKQSVSCAIDGSNPDRLNVTMTFPLSGNTDIKDLTLQFGFNYPESDAA